MSCSSLSLSVLILTRFQFAQAFLNIRRPHSYQFIVSGKGHGYGHAALGWSQFFVLIAKAHCMTAPAANQLTFLKLVLLPERITGSARGNDSSDGPGRVLLQRQSNALGMKRVGEPDALASRQSRQIVDEVMSRIDIDSGKNIGPVVAPTPPGHV